MAELSRSVSSAEFSEWIAWERLRVSESWAQASQLSWILARGLFSSSSLKDLDPSDFLPPSIRKTPKPAPKVMDAEAIKNAFLSMGIPVRYDRGDGEINRPGVDRGPA